MPCLQATPSQHRPPDRQRPRRLRLHGPEAVARSNRDAIDGVEDAPAACDGDTCAHPPIQTVTSTSWLSPEASAPAPWPGVLVPRNAAHTAPRTERAAMTRKPRV